MEPEDYDDMYENERDEFEEQYDSGFQAGLVAQIESLDLETLQKAIRKAVAEKKIEGLNPADNFGTEYMDEDGEFRIDFSDPGGGSALRAAHAGNPRILPCPRCHRENQLTPADRTKSYVCDYCADAAERGIDSY